MARPEWITTKRAAYLLSIHRNCSLEKAAEQIDMAWREGALSLRENPLDRPVGGGRDVAEGILDVLESRIMVERNLPRIAQTEDHPNPPLEPSRGSYRVIVHRGEIEEHFGLHGSQAESEQGKPLESPEDPSAPDRNPTGVSSTVAANHGTAATDPPKQRIRGRPKGSGAIDDTRVLRKMLTLYKQRKNKGKEPPSSLSLARKVADNAEGQSYDANVDRLRKKFPAFAKKSELEKKPELGLKSI